jgi:hypothetical protein
MFRAHFLDAVDDPSSIIVAIGDSHSVHRHQTFLLLERNAYSDQKLPSMGCGSTKLFSILRQLDTDEPTTLSEFRKRGNEHRQPDHSSCTGIFAVDSTSFACDGRAVAQDAGLGRGELRRDAAAWPQSGSGGHVR